jgi:UDP-N-acetylglucosamine transferase subunit ALG13
MRYGEANDLQVELAEKWAKLGMTVLCKDVNDLESCLIKAKTFEYRFPVFPQLGHHLLSLVKGVDKSAEPAYS